MSCDCEKCGSCGGGSSVLLSFLFGAAVGGILGILYAPSSGEEMRRRIKFYAEEAADKVVEKVQHVRDEADSAVKRVGAEIKSQKDRLSEALDAGRSAFKSDSVEENA